MTKWYVKELSQLTNISVQTLHYYDRIDLLKPSIRLDNGYRLYSEKDLLKLQQIIALKFFSFELSKIKDIVSNPKGGFLALQDQVQILKKRAQNFAHASETLEQALMSVSDDKSIPWETVIESIEVYQMTEQLEHSWVKEIFTEDELKEYAAFEAKLKSSEGPDKKEFEASWKALINEISNNLETDPRSEIGIDIGGRVMSWVNAMYGKEHAHLRTKKFEKGFGEGKGLDDTGMTPEIVHWMEQAMDAYWRHRIYTLLGKVEMPVNEQLISEWHQLMDDMYGHEDARKKELIQMALTDENVSDKAKLWLKSL